MNIEVWQQELQEAVRTPEELASLLELDPKQVKAEYNIENDFPLLVPRSFVARMKKGDINDPLLCQALPLAQEAEVMPGFSVDPLAESQFNPLSGLLHKYYGRVLLLVSAACALNCRYCFRRHFPLHNNTIDLSALDNVLQYITQHQEIDEVILSGGEPLLLDDDKLEFLLQSLAAIKHIKRLRIHSRMVIAVPSRITARFLEIMRNSSLQIILVTHCNHANELNNSVAKAMDKLKTIDITLLNQSVLLQGINDSVLVLRTLSLEMFAFGIMPYYLHLLDRVQGAAHFFVDEQRAAGLLGELMQQLPGYLVPKLVKEQSGSMSKTAIMPASTNFS